MMDEKVLIDKFKETNFSEYPDFYNYKRPLERGLWVLWVSKEKLGIKKLTAEQIAVIIREVFEIAINPKSINNSFTPAKGKYTSIMKKEEHFLR